jgi:transposase
MLLHYYLGLDVHKDSIVIAIAEPGRNGELRLFGTITNDLQALEKALNRIRKAHPGAILEIAYEAGPCGFGIARRLKQLKVSCLVAAPSLIPKQPGAPFKTDKRDARAGRTTLEQVGEVMRFKHYSLRTERTYREWIRRFILFHGKRHPREMGAVEVGSFLSHLAVQRQVASSRLKWSGI